MTFADPLSLILIAGFSTCYVLAFLHFGKLAQDVYQDPATLPLHGERAPFWHMLAGIDKNFNHALFYGQSHQKRRRVMYRYATFGLVLLLAFAVRQGAFTPPAS